VSFPHKDGRSDRGAATRKHILETATSLFTANGYDATSIEIVLRATGLSRGALYHHFASKDALFSAVLDDVEARVAMTVASAAGRATNPLDILRAGCDAWLGLARDPTVRQVVLIDAPAVIGWQGWRDLDDKHALGLLKAAVGAIAASGRMRAELVEVNAHLLLAMLIELSMLLARSNDVATTMRTGREAVEAILTRLAGVEPNAAW
jgi:AcrR family transcriptional regulator